MAQAQAGARMDLVIVAVASIAVVGLALVPGGAPEGWFAAAA